MSAKLGRFYTKIIHGVIICLTGYEIGSKIAKNDEIKTRNQSDRKICEHRISRKGRDDFHMFSDFDLFEAILIIRKFLDIGTKIINSKIK